MVRRIKENVQLRIILYFATKWQKLLRNKTILRLISFVLLVLFTLSITPKRYLHDLFVPHNDTFAKNDGDRKVHISKKFFHCNCDEPVISSPFIDEQIEVEFFSLSVFSSFFPSFSTRVYTKTHSFFKLRGPPLVA